jgi:tRNA uridine 5-carbamoylmethylation protein Kti12
MNISLHIVYESENGRFLTAAKTHNRKLIQQAAETTIQEASELAEVLRESDQFLANIQREEAERLQRVLKTMIPELCESPKIKRLMP